MRVVFMGTGEIAVPCLRGLLAGRDEVAGLVTQPDRPVGRHQVLTPPLVKTLALGAGVPVLQPERVRRRDALAEIRQLAPEIVVVMAYGQILPPALLEMPPLGCLNVHASLLPRHRGASCIQAAIASGDPESGISIMHMAEGLDTGDVILRRALPLPPEETGGILHDRLAVMAPGVLSETLDRVRTGIAGREPQDDALATYAPKLERGDGEIDWSAAAGDLERRVRAYHPWPGTFTSFRDQRGRARRLKIFPVTVAAPGTAAPGAVLPDRGEGLAVGCGEGILRLSLVQPDGGKRMSAGEFLTGHPAAAGGRFFSLAEGGE